MKKIPAISLCLLLMFSSVVIIINFPSVSGANLVIGDDESVYIVSGYEIWGTITVLTTGKLIVPSGTTLNATNIFLQGNSITEITGGNVILYNPSPAGNVKFNGTCSYFNVIDFAEILMRGSNGYADTSSPGPYSAYISTSKGGDAELNIRVTEELRIENSTLNLTGGNGFDLPSSTRDDCNAWTNGVDVQGYVAAGGNSSIYFNFTGSTRSLVIDNSTLFGGGGYGGDAANGGEGANINGGEGGGYTGGIGGGYDIDGEDGGAVSGHVGAGGKTIIKIESKTNLKIINSELSVLSGYGGDGGVGGAGGGGGWEGSGGGGGGYGGGGAGSSYSNAGEGGKVDGYCGGGGNASIFLLSDEIGIYDSTMVSIGGDGGDAGDGGSGGGAGGCGGGGFGGGGGAGYLGNGGNGTACDFVGSGGIANISINGKMCEISNSILDTHGGNGGNAGSAGAGVGSPSGGGGYGGGGAGQDDYEFAGDGNASGYVGSGGSGNLYLIMNLITIKKSNLNMAGGSGGIAGDGGDRSGPGGGAGGGGFGGGGGGRNTFGGDGIVSDYVGTGGVGHGLISTDDAVIIDTTVSVIGGNGGDGGTGGNFSAPGGGAAGGGGYAGAGGAQGGFFHGGYGYVSGCVGDGGNISLIIDSGSCSISASSNFFLSRGLGGFAPTSPGEDEGDGGGGAGTGRVTSNGTISQIIPMSVPLLLSPLNGSLLNQTPVFTWLHLHNSTTNGDLVDYIIQIDDDIDFSSPIDVYITTLPYYIPASQFSDGIYYWRVKANYSSPPGSSAGWSEIWVLTVSTLAPTDLNIIVDHIGGEILLNWNSPTSPILDHYLIYRSNDPHNFNFLFPYDNSITWPDPLATNWTDPEIGEGSNDINYFYIVRGVNNTGYEEQNMNIVGKYVSWLNKGWNLFSIPLKQVNTSITKVFSTIAGSYNIIQWYNSKDGKWHDSNGDLKDIDHMMGLWIHMKTPSKLISNGSAVNSIIHLTRGWNLAGYPSFVEKSVNNVFSNVPSFDAVQCYNSSDISDHWKHHKEHKPSGNDLITIKTGFGYWVYVTSDSDWNVDY